jgi:hypothetical protein
LLLTAMTPILLIAILVLGAIAILSRGPGPTLFNFPFPALFLGTVLFLGVLFVILLRRVVPGRCPECRSTALIHDVSIHSLARSLPTYGYWCLVCDSPFRKRRGAWELLPLEPRRRGP